MTTKVLDDVMNRILNDPDVFSPPYDSKKKESLPYLFDKESWFVLKKAFKDKDKEHFKKIVDEQCRKLKEKKYEKKINRWRKNQIDNIIALGRCLKTAHDKKPFLLEQMFEKLDRFGIIECKLPNMEDCGKVIENNNRTIVEEYFLYKIDKVNFFYEKKAIRKMLEYVEKKNKKKVDVIEIAFFVRKLNFLTQFMEVIKDE